MRPSRERLDEIRKIDEGWAGRIIQELFAEIDALEARIHTLKSAARKAVNDPDLQFEDANGNLECLCDAMIEETIKQEQQMGAQAKPDKGYLVTEWEVDEVGNG